MACRAIGGRGVMAIMSNVFLHLHPIAVRKSGIRLSFTWCMGGLTFFLFLAEVAAVCC
jgi:hypothetical protein